jgi:predicted DNA-binding transcriptional regulator AlpA
VQTPIDYVRNRKETAKRIGISVRTLQRMESRGEIGPRIQITDRIIGYRDSTIDKFLAARTVGGR